MKYPNAVLRYASVVVAIIVALTACNNGPKNYDGCMLQAPRTSKNDRQFRKLVEECKKNFVIKGKSMRH